MKSIKKKQVLRESEANHKKEYKDLHPKPLKTLLIQIKMEMKKICI